jgi:class 3 adenylate cyclase
MWWGYSRLMGADEEGTLERLKALRRELLDPKVAEHHGRIVKTTRAGLRKGGMPEERASEALAPMRLPERAVLLKPRTPDIYTEAINLFEHALPLDPQSVEARSRLAGALVGCRLNAVTDSPADDLARADGLVGQPWRHSPAARMPISSKGGLPLLPERWCVVNLENVAKYM